MAEWPLEKWLAAPAIVLFGLAYGSLIVRQVGEVLGILPPLVISI